MEIGHSMQCLRAVSLRSCASCLAALVNASWDAGDRSVCRSQEFTPGLDGGGIDDSKQAHGEVPFLIVAKFQRTPTPGEH